MQRTQRQSTIKLNMGSSHDWDHFLETAANNPLILLPKIIVARLQR